MLAAYSVIPYKTPWSMLSMYAGVILMAGGGAARRYRTAPNWLARAPLALLMAVAVCHLGAQAYRASFDIPADPRNPYVYAHTSTAFLRLHERLEDLSDIHALGKAMPVYIVQPDGDYWPLPWYLREFENVGYFHGVPDDPGAPVIIASSRVREELSERLSGDYMTEMHGLRPSVLRLVYIRRSLWNEFIESRS